MLINMTKEERKAYMLIYNHTEKAKAAKKAWRRSPRGVEARKAAVLSPEAKARKILLQKERRRTSIEKKTKDKEYAFQYVRREEVKARRNEKRREKRKTDIAYRLYERIRGRIKALLKSQDRPQSISKSMGCTASELKAYLESKWLPGMTWENYGFYGWHVDHIIPLSSFDLRNKEQYAAACHYTNLQPLWALDNLRKGSKQ
jgi:hypothetical protein